MRVLVCYEKEMGVVPLFAKLDKRFDGLVADVDGHVVVHDCPPVTIDDLSRRLYTSDPKALLGYIKKDRQPGGQALVCCEKCWKRVSFLPYRLVCASTAVNGCTFTDYALPTLHHRSPVTIGAIMVTDAVPLAGFNADVVIMDAGLCILLTMLAGNIVYI